MWQINKLGVILSEKEVKTIKTTSLKSNEVIYFLMDSVPKFDTLNWISAGFYFTATTNADFLTLGSFEVDKPIYRKLKLNRLIKNRPKNFAYYYIDNVSLHKITDSTLCNCTLKGIGKLNPEKLNRLPIEPLTNKSSQPIILKNILFETDNYTFISSSYKELDSLVSYLKDNQTQTIEISGHTDNTGNVLHNKKLSQARAKTVADYLIKNNIAKERIIYLGFGSEKPLYKNDNKEHKQNNRRVEIILKQE